MNTKHKFMKIEITDIELNSNEPCSKETLSRVAKECSEAKALISQIEACCQQSPTQKELHQVLDEVFASYGGGDEGGIEWGG
ncbi:hypothetical protein [Vibrio sp. WXL210]|uniref:hypothetical protein n=1 Tax=Vibrio sp. WXL210 TaxID=3450709 RepID=UPI003EC81EE5